MSEKGFKLFGTKIVMETPQVRKVVEGEADSTTNSSSSGSSSGSVAAVGEKPSTTGLPCPRCKSRETKFCYFNNYNVNQPRHFCRGCHRYWTAGGALRNVPVGAGRRKVCRPPSQEEEEEGGGGGSGAFGFLAPAGLGGVVVQQWLMSHDGFPAKRPNTGVLDRIRNIR